MTEQLTPREFILIRAHVAQLIAGGTALQLHLEAAERLMQAGVLKLDILKPVTVEVRAKARSEGMQQAQRDFEKVQLTPDIETASPPEVPRDGIAGPRARVSMKLAAVPIELVQALEKAIQQASHLETIGKTESWYRDHPGFLAADMNDALRDGYKAPDADGESEQFQQLAALALIGITLSSRS